MRPVHMQRRIPIDLVSNGLSGPLPAAIGNLTQTSPKQAHGRQCDRLDSTFPSVTSTPMIDDELPHRSLTSHSANAALAATART